LQQADLAAVISGPIPSPASTARLVLPSVVISTSLLVRRTDRSSAIICRCAVWEKCRAPPKRAARPAGDQSLAREIIDRRTQGQAAAEAAADMEEIRSLPDIRRRGMKSRCLQRPDLRENGGFRNSDKLFRPFVPIKPAGLSFALSIWRSIKG